MPDFNGYINNTNTNLNNFLPRIVNDFSTRTLTKTEQLENHIDKTLDLINKLADHVSDLNGEIHLLTKRGKSARRTKQ